MTPDVSITLGDIEFSNYEVPEQIAFGGEQALAIHELVGGMRVIDAMGRQDKPLEWSGVFVGENASERARHLDYLRIAGGSLKLSWGDFDYDVIIKSAVMDFKRFYEIPYSISCVVVQDYSFPVTELSLPSLDYAIEEDMQEANDLGDEIADDGLTSTLNTLNDAIDSVQSFAKATQAQIASVLQPILAVQAKVSSLIATVGNTISNVTTLGGILPNNPIAQQASKLTSQVAGFTQMPMLLNLQSVAGRMGANLSSATSIGKSVVTAGGNLFDMASKAYGKAEEWTTIARANNQSDPMLTGINEVTVPDKPDGNGGTYVA